MPNLANVYGPIEHASVVDSIINQIEELILSGVLKDGVRLPSERDLAEQMQVSRPKIREALKALERRGLIKARHGDGTFVAPLIGAAMSPALIDLYSRHAGAFLAYLEFRQEQEGFAAQLAAERATAIDKDGLADIIAELESADANSDAARSQDADVRFHAAIVDASHNSLLVHTMTSIYDLTRKNLFYNRSFLKVMDGTGELLMTQHKAIYTAIAEGNPDRAKTAATDHIAFVQKSYLTAMKHSKRELVSMRRKALLGTDSAENSGPVIPANGATASAG